VDINSTIWRCENIWEAMNIMNISSTKRYHIEYLPICPPKLPLNPKASQHPESDIYFNAVTNLMVACEEATEECEKCQVEIECLKLHNALSDKGRNGHIKAVDALEIAARFMIMCPITRLRSKSESKK
jgi:hypothetical protein